ncbi:MAG TPA: ParB-like protein [Phenylobacterium sp.]|nr:ParB-like protein [Phenylobacterium sp.]
MTHREPVLEPVAVVDLRPTQITVGYREVAEKRREWQARADRDGPQFLGRHAIPVVRGPKGRPYILDHHHLSRALYDEGVEHIAVNVLADLSRLAKAEFWVFCDNRGWCHPFDADGARLGYDDIPRSVAGLKDDPFRSLAGELRRTGGFAKDTTPFSEFTWADFLRRRMDRKRVQADFDQALKQAMNLAKSQAAEHLPGWCGPS